jgi:hypothetical protein
MKIRGHFFWILGVAWVALQCGTVSTQAQKAQPQDKTIPLSEPVDGVGVPFTGEYRLMRGDNWFVYDRRTKAVSKIPLEGLDYLSGFFSGDIMYFIAKDEGSPLDDKKTFRFYRLNIKGGKPERIAIAPETQEAFGRKRWALDHDGKMEGFDPKNAEPIEPSLALINSFQGKLYIGVRGTGVMEYDPAIGKTRLFFTLATQTPNSGFEISLPPEPLPFGGKLFYFSPMGPVFLDPKTGHWALLEPKGALEHHEGGIKFEAAGASIHPLDMDLEAYSFCYMAQSLGSFGLPLDNGSIFFSAGFFLSGGVMRFSEPWAGWMVEIKEDDLEWGGECTYKNEVWLTRRGECQSETRLNLLCTQDMGKTWKNAVLADISRPGMTCTLMDVTADSVVLLVKDRSKAGETHLLIRPKSALAWKPLPAAPCDGPAKHAMDYEEAHPPWTTLALWKEIPDPNKPAPAPRKEPAKPMASYWSNTRVGDFVTYLKYEDGGPIEVTQDVLGVSPTHIKIHVKSGAGGPDLTIHIVIQVPDPATLKGHESLKIAGKTLSCEIFVEPHDGGDPVVKRWMCKDVPLGLVKMEVDGKVRQILTGFGNKPADQRTKTP